MRPKRIQWREATLIDHALSAALCELGVNERRLAVRDGVTKNTVPVGLQLSGGWGDSVHSRLLLRASITPTFQTALRHRV